MSLKAGSGRVESSKDWSPFLWARTTGRRTREIDSEQTKAFLDVRIAEVFQPADSERMEALNRLIALEDELGIVEPGDVCDCGCGRELPPGSRSHMLRSCANRIWMRENRKPMTEAQKARKNALRRAQRAARAESQ